MQDLTKEDFPLPTLGKKLEQFRNEALSGLGFKLIQGENPLLHHCWVLLAEIAGCANGCGSALRAQELGPEGSHLAAACRGICT
jgi:hypothetical protein